MKKGFTLIEILVAIAIIGVGTIASLAAVNSWEKKDSKSVREPQPQIELLQEEEFGGWGKYIKVFEDKERGVICWLFTGDREGGLSCMPKKWLENWK